jgi:hypothetical protein
MAIKGGAMRLILIITYALAFCCAAVITGTFAWVRIQPLPSSLTDRPTD